MIPTTTQPRLLTPRFVLVVAVGLAYFLSLGMLLPVVPLYVKDVSAGFGGSDLTVGIVVGAFSVGAVLLRPFAGRIGDRMGRRILIVGGALTVAVGVALYLVAGSLALLIAARVIGGVGEAAFFVGAGTMITDLAPEARRGEAISYWSVAVYGGLAFGPLLGEVVLGDDNHFARVWAVSFVLALVAGLVGLFCRETMTPPADPAPDPAPPRPPLLHRASLAPGVVLFFGLVGLAGFFALVPLYVEEIGLKDSRTVFGVYGGLVLVVRIFGARLPDRLGPLWAGTGATGFSAAGLLIMAAVPNVVGLFAGTVVFSIGMSLLYPAVLTLALSGVPENERGSSVGTVSSFFDASQGLGALILGGVAAVGGRRGAFLAGAVFAAVGLVLLRSGIDPRTRAPVDHAAADQATHYLEPDAP